MLPGRIKATAAVAAFAYVGAATLTGCASEPEKVGDVAPSPAPVAVASPEPAPSVSADVSADTASTTAPATMASAGGTTPYRIRTDYTSRSDVEFQVFVNGVQVGSYNTGGADTDITSFLRGGDNQVRVTWTGDSDMPSYGRARLLIEAQRDGNWNTVMTREVRQKSGSGEATMALSSTAAPESTNVAAASAQPAATTADEIPTEESTPSPTAPVTTTAASTATLASVAKPGLKNRYVVKVDVNVMVPSEFEVELNGKTMGNYAADANQDITSLLKPGKNQAKIAFRPVDPKSIPSKTLTSTLTIGEERDGKWHTLANVAISKSTPASSSRTVTFNAE